MQRRLAAILAADAVGYSRLMGEDEAGVLAELRRLREELLDPLINAHNGRVVKLMGDGALVEFASVVDAVNCAVEVQKAMAERSENGSGLKLRIGVNLGDVIVERDGDSEDLYGDGVNVAARLEGAADPGGVCVSRTVAEQAAGKTDVAFEPMGALSLKNIAEPVEAFRVRIDGVSRSTTLPRARRWRRPATAAAAVILLGVAAAWWFAAPDSGGFDEAAALARPSGPTIAVMPFENLSGDPAQDYLADGISEDVIVELGRFRDLNVLSRQSTSIYRGTAVDVREIGEALGAGYVLEGSVRQVGDRLRVTGRLIDATSGAQVWSGAFDEVLSAANLFDVQLRITERVASAVGDSDGAIKRIDARRARTKPPEQLSSYECSMYPMAFFDDRPMQERVRSCILRVVEEEPEYWRGWVQLADALRTDVMLFTNYYDGTQAEKLDRALSAARNAVSLNPESPRAHFALGMVLLLSGDREGFYAAAEAALALGGDRRVEGQIGYWFVWSGRHELGAALLRRAIDLNPSSSRDTWHRGLADYHFTRGEYEAALEEYRRGAQPHYWWAVAEEVAILIELGRTAEARAAIDRLYALRPGIKIADIVWTYRRFQRPDADSARYVEAFRQAGIPEGRYRPLDTGGG
ncbi:MAG: adenylate/guanylate cyclase domain-containing protein [Paracoccaceae bacterium]